jgi:hypothetical protein
MERNLNESDIVIAREAIRSVINEKSISSSDSRTQKIAGVFEIILLQAVIPFLVSLTSSVIVELIKGKFISSLKRPEAEAVIKEICNHPLSPKPEMDDQCYSEVLRILMPLGLEESDIKRIYEIIKKAVTSE